jgi:hypothetical protein
MALVITCTDHFIEQDLGLDFGSDCKLIKLQEQEHKTKILQRLPSTNKLEKVALASVYKRF